MPSIPADPGPPGAGPAGPRPADPGRILDRVYAEGLRRRRRRQVLAGAVSAAGLLSLALLALGVAGGSDRDTLAGGVLSNAANPVPPTPGSDPPGREPSGPGVPLSPTTVPAVTTTPPADAATTTTTVAHRSGTTAPPTTVPAGESPTTLPGPTTTVPVVSTSVPPPGGPAGPQVVSPAPGTLDLQPQRFEVARAAGERSVAVRFWSGISPCSVLGRVDVAESATEVVITLWVGRSPAAGPAVSCMAIAVSYETVVDLEAPLGSRTVVDGAA